MTNEKWKIISNCPQPQIGNGFFDTRMYIRNTNSKNIMIHLLGGKRLENPNDNKIIKSNKHYILDTGKDPIFCRKLWGTPTIFPKICFENAKKIKKIARFLYNYKLHAALVLW